MTLLFVAAGGAAGAVLRFLADDRASRWFGTAFPWGTLVVNTVGSLVLGYLVGTDFLVGTALDTPASRPALGTGLAGALTTFSTLGSDTLRLCREDTTWRGAAYVAATVAAGLLAAAAGLLLGA